jgi:Tol biopolymer transport system component
MISNERPKTMFGKTLSYFAFPLLLLLSSSSVNSASQTEQTAREGLNAGPDIITGDIGALGGMEQFGSSGSQVGLGVSTTACNAGNVLVNFMALPSTSHPIIPHNLYRMSGGPGNNDRFEQIGQSWAKHAHGAEQADVCFICQPGGDFNHLGVGCSDSYDASQNANQSDLGSRALINPFTGDFQSNASEHDDHVHTGTSHRLLVEGNDLNTTLNPGATYYAEVQYISADEYAWCQGHPGQCNMYNNATYKQYSVSGTTTFTFSPVGPAVRMTAAIHAWPGATINPIEPAPGIDGRAFIACKVTGPVAGVWHYEYAIYNENLDRAIQSFSVPLGCAITLSNLGFHAPLNHPGFPNDGTVGNAGFSNAAWSSNQTAGAVSWSSETFAQNQNANAIRWGTLYNFRFDSDRAPFLTNATIGFFKAGTPVTVAILGPNACNVTPSPTPTATATATATAAPPSPTPTPSAIPTPVPTPVQPPGGNGKIAFSRGGEIYAMNADGSNQTNLTNFISPDEYAAWSPDGSKIAFQGTRNNHVDIYVMNSNGSNQTHLAAATLTNRTPCWSPDGAKIAFAGEPNGIYVMNVNGTNPIRLTTIYDSSPAWSPDGGKIAFARQVTGSNPAIYVMGANGSNPTRLTFSTSYESNPAWSPDGTKIAFARSGAIFVMTAYGGNLTRLVEEEDDARSPAWSPDGTRIVFAAAAPPNGNSQIFVMNADGTNRIRLTNNSGNDGYPAWQRIAAPPPSPAPTPAQALNLSTRMRVQTGENVGIGGFIITGSAPKHVLLRAIGPSLSQFGIPNVLADPVMDLFGLGSFVTITNNNWRDDPVQETAILATGIPPGNDLESAIDATLAPGSYTAIVRGNGNTSGVGLVEVYDLDSSGLSKLGNISTRAFVNTDNDVVIAGFILGHNAGADRVAIRGLGPSIVCKGGCLSLLQDPKLDLLNSDGALVAANNNWQDDSGQAAQINAAGLAPGNQLESAISVTLPPGLYTAVLAGTNNGTGLGLIEVYDLGQP